VNIPVVDKIASALGDTARWRMVELLAERPRSVGELAELTGLRQPQTTKHLQTLMRAGLVAVFPLGQRRVYALEATPLEELEHRLHDLLATTRDHAGDRDVITAYQSAIETEAARAVGDGWADGRRFAFDRDVPASRDVVWQYWVDPELLASWWAPPSLTVTRCALVPRRGGRALLEYADPDGTTYRSEGRVRAAKKAEHLAFDLSVLRADGGVMFTGHYDVTFSDGPEGAHLHADLSLTDTTVEAVPAIAGIEAGWGQVLDQLVTALHRTH
jgi:uncharacterized protein YndB with AHSA1/START domain/DNA-binding transcriptional ArsR family regulator